MSFVKVTSPPPGATCAADAPTPSTAYPARARSGGTPNDRATLLRPRMVLILPSLIGQHLVYRITRSYTPGGPTGQGNRLAPRAECGLSSSGSECPWNLRVARAGIPFRRRSATGSRRWEVRMRKRLLELVGLAAVVIAAIVLLKLVSVSTANAGAPDTTQTAARAPWGEPDLQGIWTNNYEGPVQRPAQDSNKEI